MCEWVNKVMGNKKFTRKVYALIRPDGNIKMLTDDVGTDYWFGRTRYGMEIYASKEILGTCGHDSWDRVKEMGYRIEKVELRIIKKKKRKKK